MDRRVALATRRLACTLWPHQRRSLTEMIRLEEVTQRGGIFADDTGLGKTVVVLGLIASGHGHTLVVAPSMVVPVWLEELATHAPSMDVATTCAAQNPPAVCVVSYARMAAVRESFNGWTRLVLDEAHQIRDRDSRRHRIAASLGTLTTTRWAVTGTPFQTKGNDLRTLASFACLDAELTASQIARNYLIRSEHAEVMRELPANWQWPLPVASTVTVDAEEGAVKTRKQCALLPAKVSACAEQARRLHCERGSVVVFSSHREALARVCAELVDVPVHRLYGALSVERRTAAIVRWRDTGGVLLCTLRTTGLGIDLTSARAIVLVSPEPNPFTEHQAVSRVARPGCREAPCVVRLMVRGGADEQALEHQTAALATWRFLRGEESQR
jgi:SNF2 family DNA or RNA helicase